MLDKFMETLWTLRHPSSPTADPEKLSITEPETQTETWSTKQGGMYHVDFIFYGAVMWTYEILVLEDLYESRVHSGGIIPAVIYSTVHFSALCHSLLLYELHKRSRHVPHKCLGAVGKLLVEVINFSVVMVLRQFVNLHVFMLFMLLTGHLHAIVRIMHLAYDVGARDVLLGLLMQLLGYVTGGSFYGSAAVCLTFGAVTLCRYKLYTPPVIPIDNKRQEG